MLRFKVLNREHEFYQTLCTFKTEEELTNLANLLSKKTLAKLTVVDKEVPVFEYPLETWRSR